MSSLKLHVYLANSEKQAIWTRHATMIVANSVLINGAWSMTPATVAPWLNLFGFFLRLVWGVMTWFYKTIKDGKSIRVAESLNPFADITIGERRKDTIFICAMLVVAIFASMYVVGLWPSIRIIFAWICGL